MGVYRIKQFYWSMTSIMLKEDYEFLDKFLNEEERNLFNLLSKSEQKHCVKVGRDMYMYFKYKESEKYIDELVTVSLLHDIGKTKKHITVIDKAILVILNKLTKGNLKKYDRFQRIDVHYNHPEIGYNLLKNGNFRQYNEELLELIKYHHVEDCSCVKRREELEALKFFDNNN